MDNYLGKALIDIAKAKGVMAAIEAAYLNIEVMPHELERADNAINAFYALLDIINNISDDIEALAYNNGENNDDDSIK